MTSVSETGYIDKVDDIVRKYNKAYHSTIFDSSKEINNKDPSVKTGDIVRISKYKNIFAKRYVPNWSEEVFMIEKVKNTVP